MDFSEAPSLADLKESLSSAKCPIAKRMRAVFWLKEIGGNDAVDVLAVGLHSDSVLLSHEVAYVLGQMQNPRANDCLRKCLADEKVNVIVRHEAAEALGAIGSESSLEILQKYQTHEKVEIAETCELAIASIKYRLANADAADAAKSDEYQSVDPAPPLDKTKTVEELKKTLLDTSLDLFMRYRAMFALRNKGTAEAVAALAAGFDDKSALFKHEIAYVLGQVQHPAAAESLARMLKDDSQHEMTRHEAAEALGSIADSKMQQLLKSYKQDQNKIVSQSCDVALDLMDYWAPVNDQLQQSDAESKAVATAAAAAATAEA